MSEATARRPSRWRVFAPDTAGAIYGTIAAMAVIAGAAREPAHGKALWLGVAELVLWGVLYSRRQHWSWLVALTAGAINGLFGLLIVVLEVIVH